MKSVEKDLVVVIPIPIRNVREARRWVVFSTAWYLIKHHCVEHCFSVEDKNQVHRKYFFLTLLKKFRNGNFDSISGSNLLKNWLVNKITSFGY